jgi:alcohol dehydrogenase class IV
MRFEFATAVRTIFGEGTMQEVAPAASSLGKKCLVITGKGIDRSGALLEQLGSRGISTVTYQVTDEPTTQTVLEGAAHGRSEQCDMVIGFGGGSVIDTGKAISALLTNPGDLFDYLEVIGKGRSIALSPAPYIAVPTTAGTGSEVTKNAVIISEMHGVKVSMRSPLMLPLLVVVDPELTYSLPPAVTVSTGLDAFTQLMESYVTKGANPITDGICKEGLARAARSIRTVCRDGGNKAARADMALASMLSGLTLANAGLGAVHGFAAAIGGEFHAPHGLVCACLLPYVVEINVRALQKRAPGSPALVRFDEIANIITGKAEAEEAISWIQGLCTELKVPPLSGIGITKTNFPGIVAKAIRASSMKGNPIELTEDELTEILDKAYV